MSGRARCSLAADVACGNVVVLRSFGKFFGLAGLRLGFALARTAARRAASRYARSVGGVRPGARGRNASAGRYASGSSERAGGSTSAAQRLDEILSGLALTVVGGTSLFRLVQTPAANALFQHLGHAGIWVRAFPDHPNWLRFGLPANERAWRRLKAALVAFW